MGIEKILLVDDDPLSRDFLAEALRSMRYEVFEARDGEEGLRRFEDSSPDLVLSDLKMPKRDGLALLKDLRRLDTQIPFILLTAHGTIESAVAAMKEGASDFLLKPIAPDALELVLSRAAKDRRLRQENDYLRAQNKGDCEFIGESGPARAILSEVEKVARTKATVLLTGESGCGKERIAQRIHERSPRAKQPFIRVNCAALSENLLESEMFGHEKGSFTGAVQKKEGRFELADGGTLLLDEIGEISMPLQAKLLRVLEEEEFERVGGTKTIQVDVRVIATTNRNLRTEVQKGRFREDLFFRLHVVPIHIPPLRERAEDIPLFVARFLQRFATQYGSKVNSVAPEAMQRLQAYAWPGNVRELENLMQRLAVRDHGTVIGLEELEGELIARPLSGEWKAAGEEKLFEQITGRSLAEIERDVIFNTLASVGDNKTEAAKILGVTARTLSNKLKLYRQNSLPKGV